ncbi:MAG TPA: hypothetical protein VI197_35170 [Polyangiaceae bacterium]
MRFGYEPADEWDDGLGLDAAGGSQADGGSAGSFAGADGSGDSSVDASATSVTSSGGTTSTDAAAASGTGGATSTDASGGSGSGSGSGSDSGSGSGGATSSDAGGASGAGGVTSTTTSATGGMTSTGAGGATSTGAGGATSTDGTTSSTTGGGDACTPGGTQVYLASFATDLEGFSVTGSGGPALTWNGSVGNPELGAMELDASGGGAMQVRSQTVPGDLTGRVMSANVYVEGASSVDIMLYAQSGEQAKWADGGTITAAPGQWYCLALDLDNPVTASGLFDPADVRVVGIDVQRSGAFSVYIDQFAY